jgi:hypothetical protein
MEYAIVEFTDDHSVSVVPTNWLSLNDSICYWPNVRRSAAVEKLVKDRAETGSDWTQFAVRVLHRYGTMFI